MTGEGIGFVDFINNTLRPFISEYKSSLTVFISTTIATICWITSSILGSTVIATLALASHVIPAAVYYIRYQPFGIQIDYTPTTVKNGRREVDKSAERREEALLRNGQCTIHCLLTLPDTLTSFSIQFNSPSEIHAELRDVPRLEHNYDPDANILSCDDITDYEFSFVLDIFLISDPDSTPPDDFPLQIIEMKSGKELNSISIVHS
jgi:hypothetical protein